MAKTVEDRTKFPPRAPMWASIRGKYKDVAKPDISGNVKTYDTDVAKAADLAKTKKELVPDSLNVWASDNEAKGKEINSHLTEVESLHDKFLVDYDKMQSDIKAKPDRTIDILDAFDRRIKSFITARKALWDAVVKLDQAHLAQQKQMVKKLREAVAKFDKDQAALLTNCDKLEGSIRKAVSDFQKKAAAAGNDDLVDALDNFMAGF